jgi:hypothetical protein
MASADKMTQLDKVEDAVNKLTVKIEAAEAKGDQRTTRDDKDLDAWRAEKLELNKRLTMLLKAENSASDSGKFPSTLALALALVFARYVLLPSSCLSSSLYPLCSCRYSREDERAGRED